MVAAPAICAPSVMARAAAADPAAAGLLRAEREVAWRCVGCVVKAVERHGRERRRASFMAIDM